VFESRNLDGNVPSKFKKGGALITNATERSAATERTRRAGPVRAADGKVEGIVFDSSRSDAAKELMRFPVECFNCSARGECLMCVTDVPHFKEVILMAFNCDECGWRNVEVKGGGAVPPFGTITELRYEPGPVAVERDLTRDVIKSDTAAVEIPELDLVVAHGSLGGMYTTVEGLLTALRDRLEEGNPLAAQASDSADAGVQGRFRQFVADLNECIAGRRAFTLRLIDPMANTWVYSPFQALGGTEPDPVLSHTQYTRGEEEDLELGLLDMNAPTGEGANGEGGSGDSGSAGGAAAAAAAGPRPAAEAKAVAEPSFE
jgi:zinc finger protein